MRYLEEAGAIDRPLDTTVAGASINGAKERAVHMNGNQAMGGVRWEDVELGAIPSSTAALSEIIYVGRASFRVALETEAPSPTVDTTAWFRSVEGNERPTAVVSSGPGGLAASGHPGDEARETAGDTYGVPILYDSELVRRAPRRARVASRWTLGLPLAFGGFFCGILMSPLVAPARARHAKDSGRATAPAVVAATPVATAVTPVIAPISVPAPVAPPVAMLDDTPADRLTATGATPVMPPEEAPVIQKSGLRKAVSQRPARIASAPASPSGSGSHPRAASAEAAHPWVDPWAEN